MAPPRILWRARHQDQQLVLGALIELSDEDSHHLRDVLRLGAGDLVEILDPSGGTVFSATIQHTDPKVVLVPGEKIVFATDSFPPIHLYFALCKGERNELICDWGTELGCYALRFWQGMRSVVRLRSEEDLLAKENRFKKVVESAVKQSRRLSQPVLSVHDCLTGAITHADDHTCTGNILRLVCCLNPNVDRLVDLLTRTAPPSEVHLVIGPEGDFTSDELQELAAQGFAQVSLGKEILRSEVAAITALTTTKACLQVRAGKIS